MAGTVRLWVMSDLHQELARFPWAPARPDFDVLVVAGDVHRGEPARAVDWVADLAAGRPAVMVLGNHEHWYRTVDGALAEARARAEGRGVTLLHGQGWVTVAGVAFAGCTLWTDQALNHPVGQPAYRGQFGEPILDDDAAWRISGGAMRDRHAADVAALEAVLGDPPSGTRVVVTHHAPHPDSVEPAWRGHPGAGLAASDLAHLVLCDVADLWIHGHVHANADHVPGERTRILCNPFGYGGANPGFVEALVIPVPSELPENTRA